MKKFGKFLLFLSAVGAAFAGAYYYMKNKDAETPDEDDYEDLDDSSYEPDAEDGERSYVSLTPAEASPDAETSFDAQDSRQAKETASQTVEEYFDDDDADNSLDAI